MPGIENPILFEIPEHFETERLIIRAPRPGDGQVLNEAVVESFPSLLAWIPWAHNLPTISDSEKTVCNDALRWQNRDDLRMLIFRKSDNLLAGGMGLYRIDWSIPKYEIGYWLRTSLEGQGYMTEAVNGMTRFAMETLQAERIEIICEARNVGSSAVARRAGYPLEATMRRSSRGKDGKLVDMEMYVLLRTEWSG
ncbi:MAG: GNAT family protein [Anaerolineae bacterium]